MGVGDDPFPGSWAVRSGALTPWELRHDYDRVFPDVYVRKGVALDAAGRARAAAHWTKGRAVLVGRSAAALHGARWLDADRPAELALPNCSRAPAGIRCRQDRIPPVECTSIDGFTVSTPARTAFDLGRREHREPALILLDSLCRATGLQTDEIEAVVESHPRARGLRRLREVLPLVDGGAESPQETRTRLLLIEDGLPTPTTQIQVRQPSGRIVARVDLGWEEWRVAVEYDGTQHWTEESQRTWDIEREELLRELGWRVIRVSSEQLRTRPWVICERVRDALTAAGATRM